MTHSLPVAWEFADLCGGNPNMNYRQTKFREMFAEYYYDSVLHPTSGWISGHQLGQDDELRDLGAFRGKQVVVFSAIDNLVKGCFRTSSAEHEPDVWSR